MLGLNAKLFLTLLLTVFISGCSKNDKKHNINFYYWKTNVNFGESEKKYFKKLDSEKLYIRLFDVDSDTDGYPSPKAKIKLFDPNSLKAEYIPVVFITNRTFQNMGYWSPETMAHYVDDLINKIVEKNNMPVSDEIQIDCDWTASTFDNYFDFLIKLKAKSGKKVSCTLRLHQIKDFLYTGIPPVDKGYLMCYATASPKDAETQNSILDIDLLKSYTKNINEYPLTFDVALPLYSWGVVTNHRNEVRLINNVDINGMVPEYFKQTGENTYEALDDFFLQGIYVNKGFKLRIERIDPALLNQAKNYLDGKLNRAYDIVYYHLDKSFIERFSIDELK